MLSPLADSILEVLTLGCTVPITRRQVAIVVLLETADGAAYVCFLDIILSSVLI